MQKAQRCSSWLVPLIPRSDVLPLTWRNCCCPGLWESHPIPGGRAKAGSPVCRPSLSGEDMAMLVLVGNASPPRWDAFPGPEAGSHRFLAQVLCCDYG